ncbi:hypothetical protein IQ241_24190 [Romeria aff. gracilis LEGE 07310]|uniref:Uncharacterized protein n=1 Tax=Vasconcelosia minhoensis LEGE 07310 TaxID=915328 RepID=A0A8J7AC64_9CYAN|nr:hypothetical protein [Romeria gracilis]MBE9080350.1 hypothetical protein [Romeria aff. gracilis LEGE 07310]
MLAALFGDKAKGRSAGFWLGLSFAITAFYGLQSFLYTQGYEYIIQDDARQHVIWMQRFIDPALFPDDLIADYFQSLAPTGYTGLYRLAAAAGISPLQLAQLLPLGLGLIATAYCFGVTVQLLSLPAAGFMSALLLNQTLWLEDDLVSATPRAFAHPILFAFLYYLLRGTVWPVLLVLALAALFYPAVALLGLAVLTVRLVEWRPRLRLTAERRAYVLLGAGLLVVVAVLLPYLTASSDFGPLITVEQARQLPAFKPMDGFYGRVQFFDPNPLMFWLFSHRSGVFFPGLMTPLGLLGFALPWCLKSPRLPLSQRVSPQVRLLLEVAIAALGLYVLAHMVLFQLHLPGRYSTLVIRAVLPVSAGIALTLWLESRWRRSGAVSERVSKRRSWPLIVFVFFLLLPFYPSLVIDQQGYVIGQSPELYTFLQVQPKDARVASIAREADNLPAFAQRSVLVAYEYALPYHTGYYSRFGQRVSDLVQAQYSPDPAQVIQFIEAYQVDFWLLDLPAFHPEYVAGNKLIHQFQLREQTLPRVTQAPLPAMLAVQSDCTVVQDEAVALLDAACLVEALDQ